ncbi:hypothetical protein W97_03704 [Coniosporium apollinis CBS 100218]|uniref:PH domain-containing protein n=1 Tax=Coniosporium apollinis (strain CBS 100218) TaxID=1168221 RepID=R7YRD3_CONA1|nr:uncharacterized protein W97_03704 [Coniosporium apollinis CBS 100218]EON64472.1 hypothetical protein W97_03704 [Coniosporium apollinis CBS 100218]
MATVASFSPGSLPAEEYTDNDPFITAQTPDQARHRYSAFNTNLFSLYSSGSPSQTKRALEAHLAETERRLQEASQLGTVLVQQRRELSDKLKEVETQQTENEIGPELRQKLVDLEKEFNEVGRETARAFIPKPRIPSGESVGSTSTSLYSSEAQHSPSKVSVPSRKQRNHQPSRIHDIKLATEISSSLLTQIRELQAVLAEKDEALKAVVSEKSQQELEVEGLLQRLRALDESEQRYKDENWSLETQVHELLTASKEAADREARLAQGLNAAKAEKAAVEHEFEELNQVHGKLSEEHASFKKQLDSEISGLRRNVSMGESERGALQRKVDDLISQNQELAKAVAYRMRAEEQERERDTASDQEDDAAGRITPEHSPPPSPTKATPRNGALESETLKSSLAHAHRMIQNLKNNIHREKTEKIELKRMLQDARDELESRRSGGIGPDSAVKKRKSNAQQDVFKKPARPERLGGARTSNAEIIIDDPEWEDHDGQESPSRQAAARANSGTATAGEGFGSSRLAPPSFNDSYQGSTDTSDAFETANERDGTTTETDAFMTTAETLDGDSSGDATETEGNVSTDMLARARRPSPLVMNNGNRNSYMSTASASGDDYDENDLRTPVQAQQPRYRLKINRGGYMRGSRSSTGVLPSIEPSFQDSPASVVTSSSDHAAGKTLFSELGNLSDGESEEGSIREGTPSYSQVSSRQASASPELRKSVLSRELNDKPTRPTVAMIDSGMMTEPWEPESDLSNPATIISAALAGGFGLGLGTSTRNEATMQHESAAAPAIAEADRALTDAIRIPLPADEVSAIVEDTHPEAATTSPAATRLNMSTISALQSEPIEPITEKSPARVPAETSQTVLPATLEISSIAAQEVEPIEPYIPDVDAFRAATPHEQLRPDSATLGAALIGANTYKRLSSSPELTRRTVEPHVPELEFAPIVEEEVVPVSPPMPSTPTMPIFKAPGHSPPTSVDPFSIDCAHGEALREPASVSTDDHIRRLPPFTMAMVGEPQSTEPLTPERPTTPGRVLRVNAFASEEPADVPALPGTDASKPGAGFFGAMSEHERTLSALESGQDQNEISLTPRQEADRAAYDAKRISAVQAFFRDRSRTPERVGASLPTSDDEVPPVPQMSKTDLPATGSAMMMSLQNDIDRELRDRNGGPTPVDIRNKAIASGSGPGSSVHTTETYVDQDSVTPITPSRRDLDNEFTDQKRISAAVDFFKESDRRKSVQKETESPGPVLSARSERREKRPAGMLIAEDGTSQPVREEPAWQELDNGPYERYRAPAALELSEDENRGRSKTPERGRVPFQPVDANVVNGERPVTAKRDGALPARRPQLEMADEGTQTMVSAEQIEKLLSRKPAPIIAAAPPVQPPSPRKSSSPKRSSVIPAGVIVDPMPPKSRRLSGTGSVRSIRAASPPPLPADHKQVIAAAAQRAPAPPPPVPSSPGTMGPPVMPASAYRTSVPFQPRPRTPTGDKMASPTSKGGTTPRPQFTTRRSDTSTPISRHASVSSFASELDQRFNITRNALPPDQFDPSTTDPRMIQAITQTMIGEFLWKYTRKAGRGEMSENRHRRFFWVHPYTRTLYWSEQDPVTAGRAQLKAKSVAIEAVRVVTDDNPLPPGLHRKSIIVVTPGRSIKFTATTGQRHETWFNALSYLLLRTSSERDDEAHMTDADVDEFNPSYDRSQSRATRVSHASLSSYNSRTTRTSSPQRNGVPTLAQRQSAAAERVQNGTTATQTQAPGNASQGSMSGRLSSLSGMFRAPSGMRGSFSSRRSRHSQQPEMIYDAPVVHDSAEDLRRVIETQEREADRLENVRACCDGKHDVGSLPHRKESTGRGSRAGRHSLSLTGSVASRHRQSGMSTTDRHGHGTGPDGRYHAQTEMEAAASGAG